MAETRQPEKIAELIPTTHGRAPDTPVIVEAPVTVVAPGTIRSTVGGTANDGSIDAGRDFVGRDQRHDEDRRYSSQGSNVYFDQTDNSKLWEAMMKMLQNISDIAHRLDDIPSRLGRLEACLLGAVIALVVLLLIAGAFWLGGR